MTTKPINKRYALVPFDLFDELCEKYDELAGAAREIVNGNPKKYRVDLDSLCDWSKLVFIDNVSDRHPSADFFWLGWDKKRKTREAWGSRTGIEMDVYHMGELRPGADGIRQYKHYKLVEAEGFEE